MLYKIMMDTLLLNNEQAAKNLISKLKDYNLGNVDGENVESLVSVVSMAVSCLEKIIDPVSGLSAVPKDLSKKLVQVLQTTSVDQFNCVFKSIETDALNA